MCASNNLQNHLDVCELLPKSVSWESELTEKI